MLSTSCLCVMFSLFVQSMEFPVRCRLRTLPTWCSTRLTSMEMVRPTLWISKPQPNLISKLQWRIWTQLVCLYLLSRWTVLWRVHGGGSEWRNAAEDTNWEFGPFTHCPKDSRRDDGQQLIFPEICLFFTVVPNLWAQDNWPIRMQTCESVWRAACLYWHHEDEGGSSGFVNILMSRRIFCSATEWDTAHGLSMSIQVPYLPWILAITSRLTVMCLVHKQSHLLPSLHVVFCKVKHPEVTLLLSHKQQVSL